MSLALPCRNDDEIGVHGIPGEKLQSGSVHPAEASSDLRRKSPAIPVTADLIESEPVNRRERYQPVPWRCTAEVCRDLRETRQRVPSAGMKVGKRITLEEVPPSGAEPVKDPAAGAGKRRLFPVCEACSAERALEHASF